MQLNEEQIKPVEHTEGAVLVLAGAGSGKTRVLTARVAYLLKEKNVSPYEILAITFTNKAAKEMQERITAETETNGIWISTFHSFCARVLRYDADKLGYTNSFTIYDAGDTDRILNKILASYNIKETSEKNKIKNLIYRAKNVGIAPNEMLDKLAVVHSENRIDIAEKVYQDYEDIKFSSNAMDFDDLQTKTIKLFKEHPDVLRKYQERFRYIHVDEFQDTNSIQFALVRLLSDFHKNIFVVGDEDQGIYSWRGADIGNILKFKKEFQNVAVYKLEQNYRSSANILHAANSVIKNNTQRFDKTLKTDAPNGVRVEIIPCFRDRNEADYVVGKINELIRYNGYKYGDFAILVRSNFLSRLFEEKLNLYNMPYKIYGGFKFFERVEIKNLICYMRVAVNPQDREALLRIINFPSRKIGQTTIDKLVNYADENNMELIEVIRSINVLDFPSNIKIKIDGFRKVLAHLTQMAEVLNPLEYINEVISFCNINAYYDVKKDEDNNKLENIAGFVTSIKEFTDDNPDATMVDYLESASLISDSDEITDDNYIRIATIHSVKGLEFRAVYLAGLEQGTLPNQMSIEENNIEEERRLMYVAITRAKERLTITYCSSRFRFNSVKNYTRSQFVDEILANSKVKNQCPLEDDITKKSPNVKKNPFSADRISHNSVNGVRNIKPNGNKTKDLSAFVTGAKVKHNKFGIGTIVGMNGAVASIAFDGLGIKKFSLAVAPLEVVK